ncbi:hypothetical protein P280DRAFT_484275 [Massarina eburnea CBS 473.64]|uniref:UDP-Glycosyltransferase/glycogen phosphorylase n=1 Tax=Massarina eburnea CBS 473.64 TaxID=1395130 RepID=A0A6A6RK42_9PLEO|nr:hypothetical protein P280DRAFT_484275 [Massarina eburnea CBS 473.64]
MSYKVHPSEVTLEMGDPQQQNGTIHLALYPSAHGLGHFMRIVHLAQLLHKAGGKRQLQYRLFIRANIDESVRESLKTGWKDFDTVTFSNYKIPIQPSIIQTNPYTLSAAQTWDSVRKFDATAALEQEKRFVRENGIHVIISDCPSIPCTLTVPSILVTNFTFDSILEGLAASERSSGLGLKDTSAAEDKGLKGSEKEDIRTFIRAMTDQYQNADTLIRLPGPIPMPYKGRTVDVPVHFRHANASKVETLTSLRIPELLKPGRKILLHCFGGQPQSDTFSRIPQLPSLWTGLSQTIHAPPYFYKIANDAHIPDLIAASDVVLGKLGWGMCSEVIGNGYKPFIYVPRPAFIEEKGLIEWMEEDHRRLVRMEASTFEAMEWQDAILQADALAGTQEQDSESLVDEAELCQLCEPNGLSTKPPPQSWLLNLNLRLAPRAILLTVRSTQLQRYIAESITRLPANLSAANQVGCAQFLVQSDGGPEVVRKQKRALGWIH